MRETLEQIANELAELASATSGRWAQKIMICVETLREIAGKLNEEKKR